MIKLVVEQASMVKALKRVGIGTVTGKTGNEQASKILMRGKPGSTRLELIGTDRTIMARSKLALSEAPKEEFSFALEMSAFNSLVSSLETGPLTFEFDRETEYLRFKGGGAKINLSTLPTSSFKSFDEELAGAKKIGEFKTKDMAVGLDYAALFLAWSDDKDNKDPDSQILWVKQSEFVAGPGKVLGVFRCPQIPVEFKTYLSGVQAFQKYLRELGSEKCELWQFEEVFYFVKPVDEEGEVLMFSQSPRNPPLDSSPGEILDIFKAAEAFKIDRDSLQRAISKVKVVLGDSQVVTFKLRGKGNNARMVLIGEDSKHEKSEVETEIIRGVPALEGQTLNLAADLGELEFKLNYSLLISLIKLNTNSVLTVGISTENNALNISESDESYTFNALLGFVS